MKESDGYEAEQVQRGTDHRSAEGAGGRDGDGGCVPPQMAKLFSISWLSPRIIDAITDGVQPSSINRTRLLETALPLAWSAGSPVRHGRPKAKISYLVRQDL